MDYIPYRQRCEQQEQTKIVNCIHSIEYGLTNHPYEQRHKIEMRGVTWVVRVRRSAEILFFNVDTKHDPATVKSFNSVTEIHCGYSTDPNNLIEITSENSPERKYSVIPYGRRFPKLMFFVDQLGIEALDILQIRITAAVENIEVKPILRPIQFDYPWPEFTSSGTTHDSIVVVDGVNFYVQKEYVGVWSSRLEQLIEESNNELYLERTDSTVFELFLLHIAPVRVDIPVEYFPAMTTLAEQLDCPAVLAYIEDYIPTNEELEDMTDDL